MSRLIFAVTLLVSLSGCVSSGGPRVIDLTYPSGSVVVSGCRDSRSGSGERAFEKSVERVSPVRDGSVWRF